MVLMGPMEVESLGGKRYTFVIVDGFSRYAYVRFLCDKSKMFKVFKDLYTTLRALFQYPIDHIQSDHGREFKNHHFADFFLEHDIMMNFQSQRLRNRMGLRKGKIKHCRRWLEECSARAYFPKSLSSRP